jgi:serine phosphatase RsbU (regulator of sigma subunit)
VSARCFSRRATPAPLLLLLLLVGSAAAVFPNADGFYWESPRFLADEGSNFPLAAYDSSTAAVVWQQTRPNARGPGGEIFLSARIYLNGGAIVHKKDFAGPVVYADSVPQIHSVAVGGEGTVAVAAATEAGSVAVYVFSPERGEFERMPVPSDASILVAPRIYATSGGGFVLFASRGDGGSFSLVYSVSQTGGQWSPFASFRAAGALVNPFLPFVFSHNGADVVLFQASHESAGRFSSQIYASRSTDGCASWSPAAMVTGPSSLTPGAPGAFDSYQNQRPMGFSHNGRMYMAWERRYIASDKECVWMCEIDSGLRAASVEQITDSGSAVRPVLFSHEGILSLLWTDAGRGARSAFLAQKTGSAWKTATLSRQDAAFASPLLLNGGKTLNVVWQSGPAENVSLSRVAELVPDTSVAPPVIIPRSFTLGKPSSAERVSARVSFPADSSGIAGFSWIWTDDPDEEPPRTLMRRSTDTELSGVAPTDGYWYFKAAALDHAGNWSTAAVLRYRRDRIPPVEPKIRPLMLDGAGCLPSNTFTIYWEPGDEGDDLSGYTWQLEYIAPLPQSLYESPGHPLRVTDDEAFRQVVKTYDDLITRKIRISPPPARLAGTGKRASFENRVNGIYAFTVAAIDEVGNIGDAAITAFALNKYVPATLVSSVNARYDDANTLDISILGRGFAYDGTITEVYFDRDGVAPFDYTFSASERMFRVNSDEVITGIRSGEIDEGSYRVGLVHSDRGLYWTAASIFSIAETGTVKFGNFVYKFVPPLRPLFSVGPFPRKTTLTAEYLVLACVFVFALSGFVVSLKGVSRTVGDALAVRREIRALMTGDIMLQTKKQKRTVLLRRGISLRWKLAIFTIFLVSTVVLLVSIPLGTMMRQSEERTLASGLLDRVSVLLQSLSAQTRIYLPQENILDLSFVPDQSSSLSEARYVTVTGLAASGSGIRSAHLDYVWATNDPEIDKKINTATLTLGTSRSVNTLVEDIAVACSALNDRAIRAVDDMSRGISFFTAEALSLIHRTDEQAVERRQEIQQVTTQLNARLAAELNKISMEGTGSYPYYDPTKFDRSNTRYLFYRPVVYRQGAEENYVRGIVFVEISTQDLIAAVDASRARIYIATLLIGLFAIGVGGGGAFVLATFIINPINRLARHVAMIRDTEDKEKLEGKDIVIRQKDEIGVLGETVNDMVHGLIEAAAAAKDLTIGKELQKMFIPLETDSSGRKLTTGFIEDENAHFFGYYEGVKGVSGDYFDYKPLDSRRYAIIKCDVSGKGVPASLIMVEVATLFLNFFHDWTFGTNGADLSPIVCRINDLIESRGFKGRFAAFTLCLFDSVSGDCYFCNAGDNIVHIYDSVARKKKSVVLPQSPASGVFPSFMVETKGGFSTHRLRLNRGDVLFLYTDGIEESKRLFRDERFNPISCAEPGLVQDDPHGNHSVGRDWETMASERIDAIIEAVFAGGVFVLEKWHNPVAGEKLVFDFSSCDGTAEDAILALVSVEKMFRMHKPPDATEFDRVRVDRKIDLFLRKHFKQYEDYCMNREDFPDTPEYTYYTYVREDPQYDDLALMAVKRK